VTSTSWSSIGRSARPQELPPETPVEIELELDTKPRIVRLPKDFAAALDKDARAEFDRMSYSHRKDYVDWIKEAKREETRRRRIAKAVEMIRQGKPQR
jgi:uncharacterized protein YdeI (YjbR/CyaY-like superfamily)